MKATYPTRGTHHMLAPRNEKKGYQAPMKAQGELAQLLLASNMFAARSMGQPFTNMQTSIPMPQQYGQPLALCAPPPQPLALCAPPPQAQAMLANGMRGQQSPALFAPGQPGRWDMSPNAPPPSTPEERANRPECEDLASPPSSEIPASVTKGASADGLVQAMQLVSSAQKPKAKRGRRSKAETQVTSCILVRVGGGGWGEGISFLGSHA